MNRMRLTYYQLSRRGESGQAFLEFTFIALIMILMLFALIDFGRFIYERQVMVNLSREGANLAARGTGNTPTEILSNAVNAVLASSNPLNLNAKGRVTVTTVLNSNGTFVITGQYSQGGSNATSRVGTGVGSPATLPVTAEALPQPNQTLYVAEVFYTFAPITPIGRLLLTTIPSQMYDAAYF